MTPKPEQAAVKEQKKREPGRVARAASGFGRGFAAEARRFRWPPRARDSRRTATANRWLRVLDGLFKFLQVVGIGLAGVTLLLTYHKVVLDRFNTVKPLFDLSPQLPESDLAQCNGDAPLIQRNLGGWVMFLGVTTEGYKQKAQVAPRSDPSEADPCPHVVIKATPGRYAVLKAAESATFIFDRKSMQDEGKARKGQSGKEATCSRLLAWVDADGNFYEEEVILEWRPDGTFDRFWIAAPRFTRPPGRGPIAWLDKLHLGEREASDLPHRKNRTDDKNWFCVADGVLDGGSCPPAE